MRVGLIFIAIYLTFVLFGFYCETDNYPKPMQFWNKYGFEVGETYLKIDPSPNPFKPEEKIPDTLVVEEIIDDYIKFYDGEVYRLHSLGMSLHNWKKLK